MKGDLFMLLEVEALDTYKRLNKIDNEQGRIMEEGERFKVSKERLKVLLGDNKFNEIFVKIVDENKPEVKKAVRPRKNATKRTKKQ